MSEGGGGGGGSDHPLSLIRHKDFKWQQLQQQQVQVQRLYLTDFPASISIFTSSAMGYWALAAQRP